MNGQHHIDTTIDPKTSSLPGNPESPTDPANPKRKRLTQACDICRKKKIKCDGGKPSCANCVRHHLVCTYLPSNKKRGPRQGYIEMLEKRLDKMERMLQRSQGLSLDDDDDDQDDDDSDTPDSSPRSHRSSNNTSSNTSVKRPARALDDNDDDEEHDDQRPSPSSSRSTASRLLSAQPHYPRPSDFLGMDLDDRPPPSNDTSDPFSYFGPSSSIINLGQSGLRPNTIHDNVVVPVVSPTVATISSPALSSSSRSSNASEYNVTSSAVVMGKPLMLHGPMVPLTPVDDELPPREIIDHLVDTYFDFLFNQFPIIHQATFREKVRAGKVSKVLLLSVMAVAARFSDHPAVIENPPWAAGEKYATKARVLINRIFDIPILASVQAMILLSMHEYGCARGPRAWMYSGMAVRMAQELGLNKEDAMYRDGTDSFSRMDCIEQETRRRVFWCTFMIDKFSSSSTGRPQALDERDCDVLLPSDDTDWQLDHSVLTEMLNGTPPPTTDPSSPQAVSLRPTIGVYAYLLRMVAILGQVTHYVNRAKPKSAPPPSHPNSEFALLDQALLGWAASLPPSLSYTRENGERMIPIPAGGTFFLMHILHNTVAVLLHRPNLAIRHSEPDHAMPWFKQYLDQSVEKCLKAADAVTEILERLVGTRLVTTAPFIAYATYTVATVHVGNAFSSDQELAKKAKIKLGTHHRVLQEMKPYWAMSDKLYFMIRDLFALHYKRHLYAISANDNTNPTGATSTPPPEPSTAINADSALPSNMITTYPVMGDDSGVGALWQHAKVPVPVRSDSGIVALWQMASMQYHQQMRGFSKAVFPGHGTVAALGGAGQGQGQVATEVQSQRLAYMALSSSTSSADSVPLLSPNTLLGFPDSAKTPLSTTLGTTGPYSVEMDDYFGQDISGYNFFSDSSLFDGMMFAGVPGGLPDFSTPAYSSAASAPPMSGLLSPLPLSTPELERITGMARQWQEKLEKVPSASE